MELATNSNEELPPKPTEILIVHDAEDDLWVLSDEDKQPFAMGSGMIKTDLKPSVQRIEVRSEKKVSVNNDEAKDNPIKGGSTVIVSGGKGIYQMLVCQFAVPITIDAIKLAKSEAANRQICTLAGFSINLAACSSTIFMILKYVPYLTEEEKKNSVGKAWSELLPILKNFLVNSQHLYAEVVSGMTDLTLLFSQVEMMKQHLLQDPTNLIIMKYDTHIIKLLQNIQNCSKRLRGIVVAEKSDTKCSSSALDKIREEIWSQQHGEDWLSNFLKEQESFDNMERELRKKLEDIIDEISKKNIEAGQAKVEISSKNQMIKTEKEFECSTKSRISAVIVKLNGLPQSSNTEELEAYRKKRFQDIESEITQTLQAGRYAKEKLESETSRRKSELRSKQDTAERLSSDYAYRNYGSARGYWDNDVKNQHDLIRVYQHEYSTLQNQLNEDLRKKEEQVSSRIKQLDEEKLLIEKNFSSMQKEREAQLNMQKQFLINQQNELLEQNESSLKKIEAWGKEITVAEESVKAADQKINELVKQLDKVKTEINNLNQNKEDAEKKIKEMAKHYCVAPTKEGVKGLAALFSLMNRLPQQLEQAGTDIILLSAYLNTIASSVASKLDALELECYPLRLFARHVLALSSSSNTQPSILDTPLPDQFESELKEMTMKHNHKLGEELEEINDKMMEDINDVSVPIDEEDEKARAKEIQKQQRAIDKIKEKAEKEKIKLEASYKRDFEKKKTKLENERRDKEDKKREIALLPQRYIQIANLFLSEGTSPENHNLESIVEIMTEVAPKLQKGRVTRISSQIESSRKNVIDNVQQYQKQNIENHLTYIKSSLEPAKTLQLKSLPTKFDEKEN